MTRRTYHFNVAQRYAELVASNAGAPAIVGEGKAIVTRGQLSDVADQLAQLFIARGVARRDVLGIVHTKTAECYAAMLACLRIGAVYVNLDDQNPAARLTHIFAAARPKFVVGNAVPSNVRTAAEATGVQVLDFDEPGVRRAIASAPGVPLDLDTTTGADPAYIMFTSGSTGVPKGALMSHANLLNFAAWVQERFAVTSSDVFTNVNPMYFDNSVFDFYGALLNGAAFAPVTRAVLADPAKMLEHVERAGCTIWFSVPSLLVYLTTLKLLTAERLPRIRTFVFGGEGYPKPELRKLFDLYGARSELVNVYGPTECTCICSAWNVGAADLDEPRGLVTLGPPADNFAIAVLSDDETVVAPGGVGELCLLGPQVGLGYVNDPERTAHAFTRNPLNAGWDERMYRTGDLVRLGVDGRRLDFVGRKDNQIKHMGYRIELEEIEAALHRLDGVSQAAVLHLAGRRGMKSLIAFVASERSYDDAEIRARLADLLPPYMIPQHFEFHRTLPKNANGKVDRRALADF